MAQYYQVHPTHPQGRLMRRAAESLREGGLIAYPTDSCYALGCHLGDARALERLRTVRGVDARHHLTLMCRDLAELGTYAIVDNAQYRLMKAMLPGSYTFILRGTRELPRRTLHPKRKTVGLRVPAHPVARALLEALTEPMLSATLVLPGDDAPLADGAEIRERLEHQLDLVIDAGSCGQEPTTVIDLTGAQPVVVRQGKGPIGAAETGGARAWYGRL